MYGMFGKTVFVAIAMLGLSAAVVLAAQVHDEAVGDEETLFAGADNLQKMSECKELDENYLYGEAQFDKYGYFPLPAGTLPERDEPHSHGVFFLSVRGESIPAAIAGKWKDLSVPNYKLELAPLQVELKPGVFYGFCYLWQERKMGGSSILIDHPESLLTLQ